MSQNIRDPPAKKGPGRTNLMDHFLNQSPQSHGKSDHPGKISSIFSEKVGDFVHSQVRVGQPSGAHGRSGSCSWPFPATGGAVASLVFGNLPGRPTITQEGLPNDRNDHDDPSKVLR